MNRFILLSEKKWHVDLFLNLKTKFSKDEWILINNKEDFNHDILNKIKPTKIFIPHWSYIIPKEIYETFECIVFHMTDLPFGRGGSPLQNLISRGHKSTKISALKVQKGIDTGEIYLKKELNLSGTAQEIFNRSVPVINQMIEEIIQENLVPYPQFGKIVEFKRRNAEDGNVEKMEDLEKIFDYIRMLDADGYPNAFIETNFLKVEFFDAKLNNNKNIITSNVRIIKK